MADWLADNWRDILSVAGLVVSVSGFSIAIWLIVSSRKAAVAATEAASATKEVLARNLTIDDLTRASQRIQLVKELHWEREWRRALDWYYDIRVMLSDISIRHPDLRDENKSTLQSAIHQLQALEDEVGRTLADSDDSKGVEFGVEILQSAQSLLDELASELKQSI